MYPDGVDQLLVHFYCQIDCRRLGKFFGVFLTGLCLCLCLGKLFGLFLIGLCVWVNSLVGFLRVCVWCMK